MNLCMSWQPDISSILRVQIESTYATNLARGCLHRIRACLAAGNRPDKWPMSAGGKKLFDVSAALSVLGAASQDIENREFPLCSQSRFANCASADELIGWSGLGLRVWGV